MEPVRRSRSQSFSVACVAKLSASVPPPWGNVLPFLVAHTALLVWTADNVATLIVILPGFDLDGERQVSHFSGERFFPEKSKLERWNPFAYSVSLSKKRMTDGSSIWVIK